MKLFPSAALLALAAATCAAQQPNPTPGMNMPGMSMPTPPSTQTRRDITTLQEPEDPARITGSDTPAPELLDEAASRAPLSLQTFLNTADRTSPTLAQANALTQRTAAQARQAALYPNPTIGYQGEQIRGGSYAGGEQGGFIQQTIILGGKLGARRDVFAQQRKSDELGACEQTMRLHQDITQAFYAALTAQAMVDVRRDLMHISSDTAATAHRLANLGQMDSPDVLQSELEREQAKIDYVQAQRQYLQSFRTLAALSNQPNLPVSPLAGSLDQPPTIDADHQLEAILAGSPTIKRLEQEVAVAEARLRATRRETIPDLDLRVGEQYNFEQLAGTRIATGPQSFASAGVNIPLWNRNQGNNAAAAADVERAKQDVLREKLALTQAAAPLAQNYQSARYTAEQYRTQLIPRAQRAHELYLAKYQAMAAAYPQVLAAQRMLFQLKLGYLAALHEVWMNATALQNFTLSGALEPARPASNFAGPSAW